MGKFVVRPEGPKVLVNIDDRTFLELEPKVAEAFARALIQAAKRADEVRQAERIALDSAILMRTGAAFTLSDHPQIRELAQREAESNRSLRRYIPSIRSREILGLPAIKQEAPCKT